MSKNTAKAIALCRVSTKSQMDEGNLDPQIVRVNKAAEYLGVEIVERWELAVSSRKGKNIKRKDLVEMLAYCKRHRAVKFLIVDEVDRFMRSINEYYWWKMEFKNIGVQLRHANKPEANPDDDTAVFDELIDVYRAEQSNNERITKTPEKMMAKIADGYYPCNPHSGYKKSEVPSLHIRDEPRWTAIRDTLKDLANGRCTLNEGLRLLHERGYVTRDFGPRATGGKQIDMHRFKDMVKEPYYAGIIKMGDWPVVCEDGKHEKMITVAEHERLVAMVSKRGVKFKVNRKNPEFPLPLTRIMDCTECLAEERKYSRLVGYPHHNGKPLDKRRYYNRYRCRSCNQNTLRDDLHKELDEVLDALILSEERMNCLKQQLRKVWRETAHTNLEKVKAMEGRLASLRTQKNNLVLAMSNTPDYASDIRETLDAIKKQITDMESELHKASDFEQDFIEFSDFAVNTVNGWSREWWRLDLDVMERCKQILFPDGFSMNRNKKVYTPQITLAYRYAESKTASEEAESIMLEGRMYRCCN